MNYEEHVLVERNMIPVYNVNLFKCYDCNNEFHNEVKLNLHSLEHEPRVIFTCKNCGNYFFSESDMRDHETLHKEEIVKITCNACGEMFNN